MYMKKADYSRRKALTIKGKSNRSSEEVGFDDMAAITLGDNSKILSPSRSNSEGMSSGSFAEIIAEEDKTTRKNSFILAIVLIISFTLIILVGSLLYHYQTRVDGKIRVNYTSDDFKGSNYEDVIDQLTKEGFTNIKTEKKEDLILGWLTKDGEVESVSINGVTVFSSGSRFLPDAEIIITYHTFSSD